MREAPTVGGDTMWVSLQAAYDALVRRRCAPLCDQLDRLAPRPWFAADVEAKGGYEWDGRHHDKLFPTSHPVVRTHPETGRNGLFVNSQFTRFLEGMSQARERRVCSTCSTGTASGPSSAAGYRWEAGAVAFWDNRATLHYALDDYGDALRIAHRVTLRGDRPYGPARPAQAGHLSTPGSGRVCTEPALATGAASHQPAPHRRLRTAGAPSRRPHSGRVAMRGPGAGPVTFRAASLAPR